MFDGKPWPPQPALLTENAWTLSEFTTALAKMKVNKSGDDSGIVVELVQFASRTFFQDLLHLYNVVLNTGNVPCAWNKTMFIMLAKSKNAKLPSDFRPIASVRILYKVFTYMVLARVEPVLEASQLEEQHGFRCGRRLEEHLVSANLVIDKLLAVGKPVWIVSLDLSKAFDRVNWSKLWAALASHGVSQHLVWIIQCLYWKPEGCVKGDTDLRAPTPQRPPRTTPPRPNRPQPPPFDLLMDFCLWTLHIWRLASIKVESSRVESNLPARRQPL